MKKPLILLLVILTPIMLTAPLAFAKATKLTPYQSGYQHGLKDPELNEIETPGKGPASHTLKVI